MRALSVGQRKDTGRLRVLMYDSSEWVQRAFSIPEVAQHLDIEYFQGNLTADTVNVAIGKRLCVRVLLCVPTYSATFRCLSGQGTNPRLPRHLLLCKR